MSDPDRLSSHDDKTFGRDARGLILRILCGCVSWYALLAGDHRCREVVTTRDVNSIDAFEAGNQLLDDEFVLRG
jgi:hypothetical protein